MNWDAIGSIGEIVGAAAVVVSLIYLASQIRNQNQEARLAAMHEISVGFREGLSGFSDDAIINLVTRANEDFDSLSDEEIIRLISAWYPILRVWEEAFIQWEHGRLDERIWTPMNSQFASYLSMSATKRIWDLRRQHFDQKFRDFVDALPPGEIKFR